MPIPDFQKIMHPRLSYLADGKVLTLSDLFDWICEDSKPLFSPKTKSIICGVRVVLAYWHNKLVQCEQIRYRNLKKENSEKITYGYMK